MRQTWLKTLFLTILLFFMTLSSAAFAAPKKAPKVPPKETITYVVQKGDSVDKIAKKYNVLSADLVRWNNLSNSAMIKIGQKLKIRVPKGSAMASSPAASSGKAASSSLVVTQNVYYIVKKGDNLGKIARKNGITVEQLKKNNKALAKNPDHVRVGDKLIIEVKKMASGSAVSRGLANNGSLSGGILLHNGPGYQVRNPKHSYGTALTIGLIMESMAHYAQKFPKGPKYIIGDISAQNGGKLSPHLSHQSGRDVDISYINKDKNFVGFFKANASTLDVEKSWATLEYFLKSGKIQYIFVDYDVQKFFYDYAKAHGYTDNQLKNLIQYPNGKKSYSAIMRHSKGHADHYHVRFVCANSDVNCK